MTKLQQLVPEPKNAILYRKEYIKFNSNLLAIQG